MYLTGQQWFMIVLAVLGVLTTSSANLTDLFGAGVAKYIVSASGLLSTILSAVLVPQLGQRGQVQQVLNMPGVETVKVNTLANRTLASIAVDPDQDKVEPVRGTEPVIQAISEGRINP